MHVQKLYRKKGIGSLLLREAETDIKKYYICAILLAYPLDNSISRYELNKFYAKNGFYSLPFYKRWWYNVSENVLIKYF